MSKNEVKLKTEERHSHPPCSKAKRTCDLSPTLDSATREHSGFCKAAERAAASSHPLVPFAPWGLSDTLKGHSRETEVLQKACGGHP